ncbi:tRNA (guanine-N(7)-)-methyltransferase non-catalytic subunit wdr4 [Tanacetum coccineum]
MRKFQFTINGQLQDNLPLESIYMKIIVFPKKPLDGAHEIHSFCLGHTEFVSCLAFVYNRDSPLGYLVSGSGDSTANGTQNDNFPITDLFATPDGSSIFVAVQGYSDEAEDTEGEEGSVYSVNKGHWVSYALFG